MSVLCYFQNVDRRKTCDFEIMDCTVVTQRHNSYSDVVPIMYIFIYILLLLIFQFMLIRTPFKLTGYAKLDDLVISIDLNLK